MLCSKNKDKKSESNSQLVTVQHVRLHSVPEKASSGTEYACRAQKGFLWYATRFQKPSVLKTGFWGTEGIFGTRNPLLWYGQAMCTGKGLLVYRMKRRNAAQALRSVILRKTAICMLLLLPLNSCIQLWAATKPLQATASRCKSPQTVVDYLRLPPTPLNYRRLPRPTARLPPSRPDRYQAPANYAGAYQ